MAKPCGHLAAMHGHHEVDHAWGEGRRRGTYVRLMDDHHQVTTYGMRSLLGIDHERNVQRLGRPLLGVLTPTVVTSGGGHIGMTDELLDDGDVHPGVQEIRHTRSAKIVG